MSKILRNEAKDIKRFHGNIDILNPINRSFFVRNEKVKDKFSLKLEGGGNFAHKERKCKNTGIQSDPENEKDIFRIKYFSAHLYLVFCFYDFADF